MNPHPQGEQGKAVSRAAIVAIAAREARLIAATPCKFVPPDWNATRAAYYYTYGELRGTINGTHRNPAMAEFVNNNLLAELRAIGPLEWAKRLLRRPLTKQEVQQVKQGRTWYHMTLAGRLD